MHLTRDLGMRFIVSLLVSDGVNWEQAPCKDIQTKSVSAVATVAMRNGSMPHCQ